MKAFNPINALVVFLTVAPRALSAEPPGRLSLPEQLARLGWRQIELRRTGENHLFLFGKLNGRRRSVLVDTGWSFTTVSTNAGRQLQTHREPGVTLRDPFFGTNENSSAVRLDNLKLGRVEFASQPALVQNMVLNGRRASFDVVVGCDFLMRHYAVLDCPNLRLYVRHGVPSEHQREQLEESLRRRGFVAVQLQRKEALALACPAFVNGETLEMLVDSAAPWSCVDVRQRERLGLKVVAAPAKITGVGRTGMRGVGVATVKSFKLADVAVKTTNLAVFDLADWGFAAPEAPLSEVQGILGGDTLNAAGAVIDCHALKLWVKPSSPKR